MLHSYVIYDGACGFCNKAVMFLAKKDTKNHFKFVSSLSSYGAELLYKHKVRGIEIHTLILIDHHQKVSIKSSALQKIFLKTSNYRFLGWMLFLVPRFLSDTTYDIIAKYRKRLCKNAPCEIPSPAIRDKFLV